MNEVFFIADDFGLSPEINAAIIRAHVQGVLDGASLMLGQPATTDAVRLAREHPTLLVGWHLHLNDSQPVTTRRWPWGSSPVVLGWRLRLSGAARTLMRAEVQTQWRMFCKTGLRCAFFNSHHQLHAHPIVYRQVLRTLAGGFKGWLRLGRPMRFQSGMWGALTTRTLGWLPAGRRRQRCPFQTTRTLWGTDRLAKMNASEIAAALAWLRRRRGRHEFLFHPRDPRDEGDPDTRALLRLRELLPELRPGGGAAAAAAAARRKW